MSHRRLVRWPGQKDPLIALTVGGVQPVQNIAGYFVLEEGQYEVIILLVPFLWCFPAGAHSQLLVLDDDLKSSVLVPTPGVGKDILHIIARWGETKKGSAFICSKLIPANMALFSLGFRVPFSRRGELLYPALFISTEKSKGLTKAG